jgi:hypothetical protein
LSDHLLARLARQRLVARKVSTIVARFVDGIVIEGRVSDEHDDEKQVYENGEKQSPLVAEDSVDDPSDFGSEGPARVLDSGWFDSALGRVEPLVRRVPRSGYGEIMRDYQASDGSAT